MRWDDPNGTMPRKSSVIFKSDYLTIPADRIKDIKPMMTIVGGRIAYDAEASAATARVASGVKR